MLRLAAVLSLCLATPSLQDIVMDGIELLTGVEVCFDGCEEGGADTCDQQCGHCLCSGHSGLAPFSLVALSLPVRLESSEVEVPCGSAKSAHLDPPFRPPAS